jgi:hypothetical protein
VGKGVWAKGEALKRLISAKSIGGGGGGGIIVYIKIISGVHLEHIPLCGKLWLIFQPNIPHKKIAWLFGPYNSSIRGLFSFVNKNIIYHLF